MWLLAKADNRKEQSGFDFLRGRLFLEHEVIGRRSTTNYSSDSTRTQKHRGGSSGPRCRQPVDWRHRFVRRRANSLTVVKARARVVSCGRYSESDSVHRRRDTAVVIRCRQPACFWLSSSTVRTEFVAAKCVTLFRRTSPTYRIS